MANRLRFHPAVSSDLTDAIGYYDGISPLLGARFRKMVDARFDRIESHPELFSLAFGDVRFATVRRFPYVILFRQRRETIMVLGVFHGASNPERWRERAR
ncbi:MAG: type II toxin-antitoxin system RelE/ParE family toxin [Planctomycetota bacterium]